jgi:dTDP-4-dehydrorhamnose 3,5-epimerase
MDKAGFPINWVQDNHSYSKLIGTLRGLHFQAPPHAQDKLVRCSRGSLLDVAVDIRVGSPTFGHWFSIELTPESGTQILIPKGFLHGFVSREPDTEIQYKCSDFYAPDCDKSVLWDSVGIDWELKGAPVLAEKDANAVSFSGFQSPFHYEDAK